MCCQLVEWGNQTCRFKMFTLKTTKQHRLKYGKQYFLVILDNDESSHERRTFPSVNRIKMPALCLIQLEDQMNESQRKSARFKIRKTRNSISSSTLLSQPVKKQTTLANRIRPGVSHIKVQVGARGEERACYLASGWIIWEVVIVRPFT